MITINKPIILSQTQTYKCADIHISYNDNQMVGANKGWIAQVTFWLLDDAGKRIQGKDVILSYPIDKYDAFWSAFNSGTFLEQELNKFLNLGLNIPDGSQDADFTNPLPEKVMVDPVVSPPTIGPTPVQ